MSEENAPELPAVTDTPARGSPADIARMAKEVAAMKQDLAEGDVEIEAGDLSQGDLPTIAEPDIEVPNSFWDNKEEPESLFSEEPVEDADEVATSNDVSAGQTIKFKANGKEHEISIEEAQKQLAMAEGGAQAFSKLAVANQRVKTLEEKLPELEHKAGLLDKLESVKHDPMAIIKIATGQDPEEFLADVMRKERIRTTGTEAEQNQLAAEERIATMQRELKAQEERQKAIEEREATRLRSAEKAELKGLLETEYHKHKYSLDNDVVSNNANEMLWQQGQRQLSRYIAKYQERSDFKQLLPRMAEKAFADVKTKMDQITGHSVESQLDEAIANKKQKAAESAAVASTRRMAGIDPDKYKGKSVLEIGRMLGVKNLRT